MNNKTDDIRTTKELAYQLLHVLEALEQNLTIGNANLLRQRLNDLEVMVALIEEQAQENA
jgi:hypothetical protein